MYLRMMRTYGKLGRIHSAVLTGLAPVCTAAATGRVLSLSHYIELFLIGFLFHLYLFVYNEIRDVNIDRVSKNLKTKPLIDGSISLKGAQTVVLLSCFLIVAFTVIFFQNNAVVLLGVCVVAFLLGWIYDAFGKRLPHADYSLGLMIFFVALYGGFSVNTALTPFVFLIALLGFSQMLIQNIIAGLKDVDHDAVAGGLSTPLRLGVWVHADRFFISRGFIAYILLLKAVHITLVLLPFSLHWVSYEPWQFYIAIVLIMATVVFMLRFLAMKTFQREKLMRTIGFHEMFTFMIIPLLLFSFIGPAASIFLVIFPVLWLGVFLLILYRRLMPAI